MPNGQIWGADPDQLEDISRQMMAAARRVEAISSRISSRLASADWRGTDAEAFRAAWDRSHRRSLAGSAGFLRSLAGELAGSAQAQRDASAEAGGRLEGFAVSQGTARGVSTAWQTATGTADTWQALVAPVLGLGILTRAAVTVGDYTDRWHRVLLGPKVLGIDPNTFMRYKRSGVLQAIKSLGGAEGAKGGLIKQIIDNPGFKAANRAASAIGTAARGLDIAGSLLDIGQGATGSRHMDGGDYARASADIVASSLKATKNPVSYLAGVNVSIWSDVVETGNEAISSGDFTLRGLPSPFHWDSLREVYWPTAKDVGGELVGMMKSWF